MTERVVQIEQVRVKDRHRTDLGDVEALAASIEASGLLHPPVVTPDLRLVAGERRIAALRHLGRSEVEVRVIDGLTDASALLVAERDENTCRKPMTASELVALGRALESLERPEADERRAAGLREGNHPRSARARGTGEETRNVVGKALGVHGATYKRMQYVADRAADPEAPPHVREVAATALAEMDAGRLGAEPAQRRVRQAEITDAPPAPTNGRVRTKTHRGRGAADGARRVVNSLIGLAATFDDLAARIDEVSPSTDEAAQWERDLASAVTAINRFRRSVKENASE